MSRQIGPPENDKSWVDMGTYWLNILNQGTDGWRSARRAGWGHTGSLLTASNFGVASAHAEMYKKPESLAYEMLTGKQEEKRSPQEIALMKRGTDAEPYVRRCYEMIKGVSVREVGLAIPKFDIRIGASPDGLVGDDGCIEIKCPKTMYPKLVTPTNGVVAVRDRITRSHYDQMTGVMAIMSRSWCDYCVCDVDKGTLYIERVMFDKEYWEKELYPALVLFIDVVMTETASNIEFFEV